MRILWANQVKGIGADYGYTVHGTKLREALDAAGVAITTDPAEEVDLAVHVTHPHLFRPVPGKRNLLFTTCETSPLPSKDIEPIKSADILVVPSSFCHNVFKPHFRGSLRTCHLGMDEKVFTFIERKAPSRDRLFRYLWVGAISNRKGHEIVVRAWEAWGQSGERPRGAELYLKTSGRKEQKVEKYGDGLVLDSRDLPVAALAHLYHTSDAFVSASLGEGFFLPALEAAACGLPVIFTNWSGPKDFLDESVAYPVKFTMTSLWSGEGEARAETTGAVANQRHLIQRMAQVYAGYPAALKRGQKASERAHAAFKWSDCAATFIRILEEASRTASPEHIKAQ